MCTASGLCRLPGDHQFHPFAALIHAVFKCRNHPERMLLKRAPRKAALEKERRADKKEQPRGVPPEQEERERKKTDCKNPEEDTGCMLDAGGIA